MSIKYNADIDGLRALAVMFVIFNHINISVFSGGFIGVDIFFVISGYLITSIIYKEMTEQRFSVGHFYKKRVVRLAPAFFTVLTIVSIISMFIMLPHELTQYFKSVVYSTLLMANVYMRKEAGGYFSTSVDEVPLLHLWSLGVEEQFYIFWPLLLLLLTKKSNAKWLVLIILSLIVLSLFYAEQQILKNAGKAYYRMPVRASEMFLGALCCFVPVIKIKEFMARIIIWLSLLVLIACAMLFDEKTKFPGINAIIPCLATAIIIYLSQLINKNNSLLANQVSTWVGKISYPMYLWHWPLVVFLNIYLIPFDLITQVFVVVVTIILAYLTYKYIELPSRKWLVLPNKKVIIIGFLLPSLSFSVLASVVYYANGFPNRFDQKVSDQVIALESAAHVLRHNCHDAPKEREILPSMSLCTFGEVDNSNIDLILLGDSHANSFVGALDVWAKDADLKGYDPTQSTTLYLPDVELYEEKMPDQYVLSPQFKVRNDSITKFIQKKKYSITIITGYFSTYLGHKVKLVDGSSDNNQEVFERGMQRALTNIFKVSDRVIIVLDVPELHNLKANCFARVYSLGLNRKCEIPMTKFRERDKEYLAILEKLKQDFPKLEIVNPNKVLCDNVRCKTDLNGIPLYRDKDNNHFSYYGSVELGREYLKYFGNPLRPVS